ncbi:unnamed protein product [Peniophora sp. CBMAI 1063]|nr:unnamed protein product [Peniophora sp. CBMAI 1063]
MITARATIVLLAAAHAAFGQELNVPSSWTDVTVTDTPAIRHGYANDAAQALVSHLTNNGSLSDQINGQALASMYTTLAMQDWLSGNETWKTSVTQNLQTWVQQNDPFGNGTKEAQRTNTNGLQWGIASYYAYKAYNQTSFLTMAQSLWDTTVADFITADITVTPPKSKPTPPRNITWLNATGCFDKVAAGGVFWLPGVSNNAQIQQDTVGSFATLAGNLYEATRNETYKTLGLQTVSFMEKTMHNASSNLQYGVFDVQACQVYTGHSPSFQGWYLLPLSIWANITNDSSMLGLLRQVVSTSVLSSDWTETNSGLLTDPNTDVSDNVWDDKAILVRALSETLRRFPSSTDLTSFIQSFLAVQYNELVGNARSGSNYSTSLVGPAPPSYNSDGNIVALDVLNAAAALPQGTAAATSTSSQAPSTTLPAILSATTPSAITITSHVAATTSAGSNSSSTSSAASTRPMIGGTVGGLPFFSVFICVALWYCCASQGAASTLAEDAQQKRN